MQDIFKNMFEQLAALFRSNARALVMQLLFGPHHRSMYLSEISYVTGMASRSIEVEVKHLKSIGILTSSPDRSRVYYAADQSHPLYPELYNLVTKAAGIEGRLREALAVSDVLYAFLCSEPGTDADSVVRLVIIRQGRLDLLALVSGAASGSAYALDSHILDFDQLRNRLAAGEMLLRGLLESPRYFIVGKEESFSRTLGELSLTTMPDRAAKPT
jgi:hypothetical protein